MLDVRAVHKTYEPPRRAMRAVLRSASSEPVDALRDISFRAEAGEIVGIVGPNGAGKSTLIRIIANLLTPTSGSVHIDGRDVTQDHATDGQVGLMLSDERALYWRLTGRQNLEFFGAMAGLGASAARKQADTLMEEAGLSGRDRRVFGYSSGMRVQLGLARALMHDPALLVLDEPSRSLDPLASDELLDRLRVRAQRGCTVLLSSHRLDEVEALCDRVLVIVGGSQRFWGTTNELRTDTDAVTALRRLLADDADPGAPTAGKAT